MDKTIHIAVCDDEKRAISIISSSVKALFDEKKIDVTIDTFLSPLELLDNMKTMCYQLIFLDISMQQDGIEVGKQIKMKDTTSDIIFVSNKTERVFDTFSIHPFGFVRKNNFLNDISDVINLYVEKKSDQTEGGLFHFKDKDGMLTIKLSRLKYIECSKNIQLLTISHEREPRKLYSRMEILEQELDEYDFIRIHKGYLINCNFLKRFDSKSVTLSTGEELPVGRSYQHKAMDKYLLYISKTGVSIKGR